MGDDIVARLRRTHRADCECVGCEAAGEIERLRGELFPIRKELEDARAELESKTDELNCLREMRDRWIAATQLHAARANQSPPEIRSHWDSADA